MFPTSSLVFPEPFSNRVTTTASHPQLRDLLVLTPSRYRRGGEPQNSITVTTFDSLANHSLYNDRAPLYTPLSFTPCCLTSGKGFIVCGGQNSELALKSSQPDQDWCYQFLPHHRSTITTTSGSVGGGNNSLGGSIVNSINLHESPSNPSTPRLLVSSNDEVIKVFDIVGQVPDWEEDSQSSRRRNRRTRTEFSGARRNWFGGSSSVVDQTYEAPDPTCESFIIESEEEENEGEAPEETSSLDLVGGPCQLIARPELDIENLSTPINHSSLSPDGTKLVAVGDTDQVFLFDVRGDEYKLRQVVNGEKNGRKDASFSTDWEKSNGHCFVVGSQDGFVTIYDQRQLPPSDSFSDGRSPRTIANFQTTQRGPAGAVRKVSFSPGGSGKLDSGLLAFTEHRNRIHLIDSRNFQHNQILEIPTCSPNSSTYHSQLLQHYPSSSQWSRLRVPGSIGYSTTSEGLGGEGEGEGASWPLRNRPIPLRRRQRMGTIDVRRERQDTRTSPRAREEDVEFENEIRRERQRHDLNRQFEQLDGRIRPTTTTTTVVMELPDEGRGQVWPIPSIDEDGMEIERTGTGGGSESDYTFQHEEDDEEDSEEEESGEEEEEEEEDSADEEDSIPSSINTTRARRFEPNNTAGSPSRTYSSVAASSSASAPIAQSTNSIPYTTLTRYSTSPPTSTTPFHLPPPPPPNAFSLFAAPLLSNERSSTPPINSSNLSPVRQPRIYPFSIPTYSYSASVAAAAASSAAINLGHPQGFRNLGGVGGTNGNFPIDTSEYDLLGLDWGIDERTGAGERLLVATGKRVFEWDVDKKGRRCKGTWDFS
ncbi:hypothetical protein JCM3765_005176 [Sporobolomyces pararoseus]